MDGEGPAPSFGVAQRIDGLWLLEPRRIRPNDRTTTNEWS